MAQLLPENWRQTLARLRGDIHQALDRWVLRRRADERETEGRLPVRRDTSSEQFGADLDLRLPGWRERALDEELSLPLLVRGGRPRIEMEETDDEIIVTAEIPGLDKENFTVEIVGNRLVLRGEKRHETEEQRRGYYYAEHSYGTFTRVLALPCEVDAAKAIAVYKNGLLRLTLPKTTQAKARRHTVQVH